MISIYVLKENKKPFYVGYSKNPTQRLNLHRYNYGTHIEMEILEEVTKENKKEREIYWVKHFKDQNIILKNKNEGGGGPTKNTRSPETIKSFKLKRKGWSRKGTPQPSTYKERIKEKLKYRERSLNFRENLSKKGKGKSKPEGFSEKISKSKKGIKNINNQKPIIQLDLNESIIKEWESIKVAATELGLNPSTISKVCRGIFNQTGGYKFKYITKTTKLCRKCNKNLPFIEFVIGKSYCRDCVFINRINK
jgi:predicted GIY-YIG superfamily endonuclease